MTASNSDRGTRFGFTRKAWLTRAVTVTLTGMLVIPGTFTLATPANAATSTVVPAPDKPVTTEKSNPQAYGASMAIDAPGQSGEKSVKGDAPQARSGCGQVTYKKDPVTGKELVPRVIESQTEPCDNSLRTGDTWTQLVTDVATWSDSTLLWASWNHLNAHLLMDSRGRPQGLPDFITYNDQCRTTIRPMPARFADFTGSRSGYYAPYGIQYRYTVTRTWQWNSKEPGNWSGGWVNERRGNGEIFGPCLYPSVTLKAFNCTIAALDPHGEGPYPADFRAESARSKGIPYATKPGQLAGEYQPYFLPDEPKMIRKPTIFAALEEGGAAADNIPADVMDYECGISLIGKYNFNKAVSKGGPGNYSFYADIWTASCSYTYLTGKRRSHVQTNGCGDYLEHKNVQHKVHAPCPDSNGRMDVTGGWDTKTDFSCAPKTVTLPEICITNPNAPACKNLPEGTIGCANPKAMMTYPKSSGNAVRPLSSRDVYETMANGQPWRVNWGQPTIFGLPDESKILNRWTDFFILPDSSPGDPTEKATWKYQPFTGEIESTGFQPLMWEENTKDRGRSVAYNAGGFASTLKIRLFKKGHADSNDMPGMFKVVADRKVSWDQRVKLVGLGGQDLSYDMTRVSVCRGEQATLTALGTRPVLVFD